MIKWISTVFRRWEFFMDGFKYTLQKKYENNKQLFRFCIFVTFVIGMVTHAYMYFQDSFSHDSLGEFYALSGGNTTKIAAGRFMVPVYRMLVRGNLTLPWLIGVISLFFVAASVFLTVKMLKTESKPLITLSAGIFVTNVAVVATTATYMHDLDSNMLALFLAVAGVFIWREYKYGYLFAIPCIVFCLGLYQAYISVAIVLALICLIRDFLNGEKLRRVFSRGIKSVIAFIAGGAVYFVCYKLAFMIEGIEERTGAYNSVGQVFSKSLTGFIESVFSTTFSRVYMLFYPKSVMPAKLMTILVLLMFAVTAIVVLIRIFNRKIGIAEKILSLVLITLLPVGMCATSILSGIVFHDVMSFADSLIFLFVLLMVWDTGDNASQGVLKEKTLAFRKLTKSFCVIMVALIIASNVITANELYLKKDLEQEAALSYFTRVLDKIDEVEGYDREKTPIMFVGNPENFAEYMKGFDVSHDITGATYNNAVGFLTQTPFENYFEYKLHYRITVVDHGTFVKYREIGAVKQMPSFPDEGCMQMIDGILVVKLNDFAVK